MKKFLAVEILICYFEHTWNTDYVYIPYPEAGEMLNETKDRAIEAYKKELEEQLGKVGTFGCNVAYLGIYNINWDEPVDENGDPIDE